MKNPLRRLEPFFWSLHSHTWDDYLYAPDMQARIHAPVDWLASYRQSKRERVLDIGCGTGNYALALAGCGFEVAGVDFAAGMLEKAKAKAAHTSVKLGQADLNDDLPFASESFDAVICIHVLQCVADANRLLRETARVLKPSGRLMVIAIPPRGTAPKTCYRPSLRHRIIRRIKSLAWVPRYNLTELTARLNCAGMKVTDVRTDLGPCAMMARKFSSDSI